jgi:hypothetical protein
MAAGPEAERADEEARRTMREIVESLRTVLPLSVNDEEFRAERNRTRIHQALQNLASNAGELAAHVRDDDPAPRFYRISMARDATETLQRYEARQFESARYFVRQLTEYCVACHARLPSPGDSPLGEHFIDVQLLAALEPAARAQLQVAIRRFDDALVTLERLLESPLVHPADLLGPLTDYLVISIRVKGDVDGPIEVLERLGRRPDTWENLRVDIEQWIAALRLVKREPPAPDLASARRLIEQVSPGARPGSDRQALVRYIVASSLLHRFLDAGPRTDGEVAEAYYWLGLVESRIGRGYWVSQADVYLEASIRLAPRGPFAVPAYRLLEEETVLGFQGETGVYIPPAVAVRLAELRRLVHRR